MSCQQCQLDYLHDKTAVLEQIVRRMVNVLTFSEQSDQVLKANHDSAKDLAEFGKRWPKRCEHVALGDMVTFPSSPSPEDDPKPLTTRTEAQLRAWDTLTVDEPAPPDEPLPPGQAAEILAKEPNEPVNPAPQTPQPPVKRGPGRPPGPKKLV